MSGIDHHVAGDDYFGVCPRCGQQDGYLNHGQHHWMVCHRCRVRWYIGSNLFDSWKVMTEEERDRDWLTLAGYEEVGA